MTHTSQKNCIVNKRRQIGAGQNWRKFRYKGFKIALLERKSSITQNRIWNCKNTSQRQKNRQERTISLVNLIKSVEAKKTSSKAHRGNYFAPYFYKLQKDDPKQHFTKVKISESSFIFTEWVAMVIFFLYFFIVKLQFSVLLSDMRLPCT